MPVQINEVIIRTVVDTGPASKGNNQSSSPAKGKYADYEAIEKVLEIIKEKKER